MVFPCTSSTNYSNQATIPLKNLKGICMPIICGCTEINHLTKKSSSEEEEDIKAPSFSKNPSTQKPWLCPYFKSKYVVALFLIYIFASSLLEPILSIKMIFGGKLGSKSPLMNLAVESSECEEMLEW